MLVWANLLSPNLEVASVAEEGLYGSGMALKLVSNLLLLTGLIISAVVKLFVIPLLELETEEAAEVGVGSLMTFLL